jgi:hypothetical protein
MSYTSLSKIKIDTLCKDPMIQMRIVRSSDLKPRNVKEKRFGVSKMHKPSYEAFYHSTI